MPGINNQVSSKGPAISRAVPALQMIEQGIPALAPAFGGAYGVEHRRFGETDSPSTMYNQYRVRATMTGAQTITGTASSTPNWQLCHFNSVTGTNLYDRDNDFSAASFQYKAPFNAEYLVTARVSGTKPSTTGTSLLFIFGLSFFANGGEYSRGYTNVQLAQWETAGQTLAVPGPFCAVHADVIVLNQGDLLDSRVANYGIAALPAQTVDSLTTDTTLNFFTVRLLNLI